MRLLLIHGFGCDHRFWGPQLPALAEHDLLTPDLPYHGGPVTGVPKNLEGLADWLVRTHLQDPAVLIGHSLGGMIALQIAHDHPARVRGLALVDSFASLELNATYLNGLYCEARRPTVLRQWIDDTRAEIIAAMSQATHDELWPSVAAFDARGWLAELTCPLLGVYGGRGRYGAAETERLRRDLLLDRVTGGAEVVVVPEAAHFVNLEQPEAVNAVLVAWLAELDV